jgi:preprotein translocase subunit SecA
MEPLDARDLRDMDFASAESYVKDQAEQAIANQIHDILEENLSEDVDPEEWNWEAVAKIANTRWQLSLPARELKRVGRDALYDMFHDKAAQVVREVDLSEGAKYLERDFGVRSALGWAKYKFGVDLELEKFKDLDPEEFKAQLRQAAREAYARKEAEYPVMAGIYKFSRPDGPNSRRIDRDALLQWARDRFHVELDLEDLKSRQREEVMQVLVSASQSSQAKAQQLLEEGLSKVDNLFGSGNGATARAAAGGNGAIDSLATWLADNLQVQVPPDDIGNKTETELKHEISQAVEGRFHTEIRRMEQLLLLELLDSAWKDHLLAMDHLKQSIGMRGYAQIDPKVEYKREGMRMFEQMWQSIGEEATRYLFHMEHLNEDFVGSTWTQGQAKHDTAPTTEEIARQQQGGQQIDPDAKIEPIRHHGQRVGRNDPCPCGSGKKYKHCCLRKAG